MAQNAKENAQLKGRQTKLMKKSHDELVSIVLKKDKIERSLNAQISTLKGEVNSLTSKINNYSADMEGTIKELSNIRDDNKTKQETIDSLRVQLNDAMTDYREENKLRTELKSKYNNLEKIAWTVSIAFVICAIGWIFC